MLVDKLLATTEALHASEARNRQSEASQGQVRAASCRTALPVGRLRAAAHGAWLCRGSADAITAPLCAPPRHAVLLEKASANASL